MAVSMRVRVEEHRRAGSRCEYCHLVGWLLSVEHVVPGGRWTTHRSRSPDADGPDNIENVAAACFPCNMFKSNRVDAADPETGEMTRLFHPRREAWSDQFDWGESYLLVVGQTAVGRATVRQLRMNDSAHQTQRRLLPLAMAAGGDRWL